MSSALLHCLLQDLPVYQMLIIATSCLVLRTILKASNLWQSHATLDAIGPGSARGSPSQLDDLIKTRSAAHRSIVPVCQLPHTIEHLQQGTYSNAGNIRPACLLSKSTAICAASFEGWVIGERPSAVLSEQP